MTGSIARVYRRLGARYLHLLIAAMWTSAAVLTIVFVQVVTRMYINMDPSASFMVTAASVAGVTAGIAATFVVLHRRIPSLRSWLAGARDQTTAEAAWKEAAHVPSIITRYAYPFVVAGVIPANAMFNRLSDLPWFSQVAIIIAILMLIGLGIALELAIVSYFLRPVMTEISLCHPASGREVFSRPSSLLRRIIASVLLVVPTSGWLAAAATARETRPSYFILYVILASVGITITYTFALTLALADAFVRPVGDLLAAQRRVAGGDLSVQIPLVSTDELGQLTQGFNEMVTGLSERQALHSALGAYIDPVIADRLLAEGEILSGDETDVTIMFVDIVGFTAHAEHLRPDRVVAELNEFFGIVIPVIAEHGGHTNKLLGDGLMAVFGAPVALDDHADQAMAAAREIQRRLQERYADRLRAGIGLNSGPVVVGTTGGGTKLEFTVIGDAVNVAQRVEALTRETGDDILLTQATRDAVRGRVEALTPRGRTAIRGREEHVQVFAAITRPG